MDLLIALGIAALLSRVGFALYSTGLVRAKNSAGTMLRAIGDTCISVLAFWMIGAAILVQTHNKWFWINHDFLFGPGKDQSISAAPALFFYIVMVLTATSVVGGAVAERCRLIGIFLSSLLLAGFVFPTTCHWVWAGWLKQHGFVDIAGGASLHVAAGAFALMAAILVGPRVGKFNRDQSSSMIPGHNLPIAAVGVLLTLIGWIPYVGGASILRGVNNGTEGFIAGAAAMNVLLAASAAGVASLLLSQLRYGKTDVLLTLAGILGGLVSACGGAVLPPWAAVVTGAIAGVIVPLTIVVLDVRLRLDDPLGVISIHLVGGAWGALANGIFITTPIVPLNRAQQIGMQVVGIAAIAALSAVVATILFSVLSMMNRLRVKEADEFDGLDLAEHDIGAYPDFQQNSIKSYHLREA